MEIDLDSLDSGVLDSYLAFCSQSKSYIPNDHRTLWKFRISLEHDMFKAKINAIHGKDNEKQKEYEHLKDIFDLLQDIEPVKAGGKRKGAGRKAKHGETIVMRVPKEYKHVIKDLMDLMESPSKGEKRNYSIDNIHNTININLTVRDSKV